MKALKMHALNWLSKPGHMELRGPIHPVESILFFLRRDRFHYRCSVTWPYGYSNKH